MKAALVFPEVAAETPQRPSVCARCGRKGMVRHRVWRRPLVDLRVPEVRLVQYQCPECGASVTVPPPGVKPKCRQSCRTKVLSVVLWGLGISYARVAWLLTGLKLPISDVGVLKNVRALGEVALARQRQLAGWRAKVPVLGADETQMKLSGNGVTVGFLTDVRSGEIVGIELLASREGEELARWLSAAAKQFGAKVLVSDELDSYKNA